jgi:hypothetical protein
MDHIKTELFDHLAHAKLFLQTLENNCPELDENIRKPVAVILALIAASNNIDDQAILTKLANIYASNIQEYLHLNDAQQNIEGYLQLCMIAVLGSNPQMEHITQGEKFVIQAGIDYAIKTLHEVADEQEVRNTIKEHCTIPGTSEIDLPLLDHLLSNLEEVALYLQHKKRQQEIEQNILHQQHLQEIENLNNATLNRTKVFKRLRKILSLGGLMLGAFVGVKTGVAPLIIVPALALSGYFTGAYTSNKLAPLFQTGAKKMFTEFLKERYLHLDKTLGAICGSLGALSVTLEIGHISFIAFPVIAFYGGLVGSYLGETLSSHVKPLFKKSNTLPVTDTLETTLYQTRITKQADLPELQHKEFISTNTQPLQIMDDVYMHELGGLETDLSPQEEALFQKNNQRSV